MQGDGLSRDSGDSTGRSQRPLPRRTDPMPAARRNEPVCLDSTAHRNGPNSPIMALAPIEANPVSWRDETDPILRAATKRSPFLDPQPAPPNAPPAPPAPTRTAPAPQPYP